MEKIMKPGRKRYFRFIPVLIVFLLLLICCFFNKDFGEMPDVVYLKENDEYIAYYMFPDRYDGKTLLLRVNATEEKVRFNDSTTTGSCSGYYPGSELDDFLTNTFSTRFSEEMLALIEDTSIKVVSNDSVWGHGTVTEIETIERKFFALSSREMGVTGSAPHDGKKIPGISKIEKGELHWLRSSGGDDDHHAYVFGDETYGTELVVAEFKVRPAFTISPDVKPVLKDGIIEGQQGYVIEP